MYNVHMLVIKNFLDSINNKGQRKLTKEIRHYFMASSDTKLAAIVFISTCPANAMV